MTRLLLVALAAVGGIIAALPSRDASADTRPLPADLALVPPDAVGFAHVRAAELWQHPELKPWRSVFEQAGQKTVGLLDQHFAPKPSTTDRVTFVLLPPGKAKQGRGAPFDPFNPTLILHFTTPFDKEQVKQAHAEKAKAKTVGGKDVLIAERSEVALGIADDRTLVLGDEAGVTAVLSHDKKAGPLSASLRLAAGGKPVVAGLNVKALPIPAEVLANIPDEYKPLADVETVTASIDVTKAPVVNVRLAFPNAESAKTGEKAFRKLADLGRVFLNQNRQQISAELAERLKPRKDAKPLRPIGAFPEAAMMVAALGGLNVVDDVLANPPVEVEGADLTASVTLPPWTAQFVAGGAVAAGVFMPAVQKVREASENAVALNNLRQIGLALHNYESAHGHFPAAATLGKKGKKLLSWRVAILPYIEQENVFRQFKQDEPWDSEHNKKFSDVNIKTYTDPRVDIKPGHTTYKALVGNGAMFDWVQTTKFAQVTDGLSNTVMVMAGGEQVPWAKPDDFEYDPKKEFPADFAKDTDDRLAALFGDGSVRTLNLAKLRDRAETMRRLIERADGNVVNVVED
jgi:hypothetical protein